MKIIKMSKHKNSYAPQKPFRKKLKVFALIGLAGFVFISGLFIWMGVAAFRFASEQVQVGSVKTYWEAAEAQLENLPAIATENCLNKAQGLLNAEAWLTRPLAQQLNSLKVACLQAQTKDQQCEGEDCASPGSANF